MDKSDLASMIGTDSFSADFWQDKVWVADKAYPTGFFIVDILNFNREHLPSFKYYGDAPLKYLEQIKTGYLSRKRFDEAKSSITELIKLSKLVKPFPMLDSSFDEDVCRMLFSDKEFDDLEQYIKIKTGAAPALNGLLPARVERNIFSLEEIVNRYTDIHFTIITTVAAVRSFCNNITGLKKYDESHLIQAASRFFQERRTLGQHFSKELTCKVEYHKRGLSNKKNQFITVRRMYFDNLLDFLIADFYEGIHQGHYPKKCGICGSYFLIENGRNQKYCDGIDPNDEKGRPCRKVAADRGRKERETGAKHPIKRLCAKRLNTICRTVFRM